jgi:HAD superfamily hydrolase (TIGR01509 family)
MVKAVIFDCFGVLVRDGWLPFRDKYFGEDRSKLQQAITSSKKVDAGLIGFEAFIRDVATLAGITTNKAHKEIEDNPVDKDLLDYIQEHVKPSYKVGLLSNAGNNWLSELFTKQQLDLFDATVLSCEIGAIKPDPIAYETIASRLGVDLNECIFIDDQPRYCQGARDAGMEAVHYLSLEDLKHKMQELLI